MLFYLFSDIRPKYFGSSLFRVGSSYPLPIVGGDVGNIQKICYKKITYKVDSYHFRPVNFLTM
jgi:hypothetical protein